jgi:hypothetical protein
MFPAQKQVLPIPACDHPVNMWNQVLRSLQRGSGRSIRIGTGKNLIIETTRLLLTDACTRECRQLLKQRLSSVSQPSRSLPKAVLSQALTGSRDEVLARSSITYADASALARFVAEALQLRVVLSFQGVPHAEFPEAPTTDERTAVAWCIYRHGCCVARLVPIKDVTTQLLELVNKL